jgi:hypothetical protein
VGLESPLDDADKWLETGQQEVHPGVRAQGQTREVDAGPNRGRVGHVFLDFESKQIRQIDRFLVTVFVGEPANELLDVGKFIILSIMKTLSKLGHVVCDRAC